MVTHFWYSVRSVVHIVPVAVRQIASVRFTRWIIFAEHLHLKRVELFDRYRTDSFSIVSGANLTLRYALITHMGSIKLRQKGALLLWYMCDLVIDVWAMESFVWVRTQTLSEALHANFFHMIRDVSRTEPRVLVFKLMEIKPDTPLGLIRWHKARVLTVLIPEPRMSYRFCTFLTIHLPIWLHLFWSFHAAS